MKVSQKDRFYIEHEDFVSRLAWATYDNHIFTMEDGSIGCCYSVDLPATDLLDGRGFQQLSSTIDSMLKAFEENTTVQIMLTCSPDIHDQLDEYEKATKNKNEFIAKSVKTKVDGYLKGAKDGFFQYGGARFYSKRVRLIITVRHFPALLKITMVDKIAGAFTGKNIVEEKYFKNVFEIKKNFRGMMLDINQALNDLRAPWKHIDINEFIAINYTLLNPKRCSEVPPPKFDPSRDIREQVLFNSPEGFSGGWKFEGVKSSVISIRDLPGETVEGMITKEMSVSGGIRQSLMDLQKDFTVVFNIYVPVQYDERVIVEKKKSSADRTVEGNRVEGGKRDTNLEQMISKECEFILNQMNINNERLLNVRLSILVHGDTEDEFDLKSKSVLKALARIGCQGIREDNIGAGLYLDCLPLNYIPNSEKFIFRQKKMLTGNLADMLPFYGSWTGTPTPDMLLLNRRGQLSKFSVWDSDGSPMAIVVGTSGAGKSFFMVNFVNSNYRDNCKVIIFDRGYSYTRICDLLKGKNMKIDPNKPATINPLHGILTKSKESFILACLSQMLSGGKTSEELTTEMENVLMSAVRQTYLSKSEPMIFQDESEISSRLEKRGSKVFVDRKRRRVICTYDLETTLKRIRDYVDNDDPRMDYVMELCYVTYIPKEKFEGFVESEDVGGTPILRSEMIDKVLFERRIKKFTLISKSEITNILGSLKDIPAKYMYSSDDLEYDARKVYELKAQADSEPDHERLEKHKRQILNYRNDDTNLLLDNNQMDSLKNSSSKNEFLKSVCESDYNDAKLKGSIPKYFKCIDGKHYIDISEALLSCIEGYWIEYERADEESLLDVIDMEIAPINNRIHIYYRGEKELDVLKRLEGINIIQIDRYGTCSIQREVYMTHLDQTLGKYGRTQQEKDIASRLSLKMQIYVGEGTYAKFFDGPNKFEISEKFTCIETVELDVNQNWVVVLLFSMFNQIYEFSQRPEERGNPKLLLLEEGWSFLKGGGKTSEFLGNVYRTGRKFRLSSTVITQQVDEFLGSIGGKAIVANSPNRFLLMQTPVTAEVISDQLRFNSKEREMLHSVKTVKGSFSEVFISCTKGSGVMRLVPDPLLYWSATSDPKDNAYLSGIQARFQKEDGLDAYDALVKAIEEAMQKHPYGV